MPGFAVARLRIDNYAWYQAASYLIAALTRKTAGKTRFAWISEFLVPGRHGRYEEALSLQRDAYFGFLKLLGEEHGHTLLAAYYYAANLLDLKRYAEARKLLRKTLPVARRVLGVTDGLTLRMSWIYAKGLIRNDGATLDHLHEAVNTFEEIEPSARRVFGGADPLTMVIERDLQGARAELRARETPPCTCVPVPPPSGRS